jgi:hypothetical protein
MTKKRSIETHTADQAPPNHPPLRRYRVTVIEWLSHKTIVEAHSSEEAEAKGLKIWADGEEGFSFDDQGVDGAVADELGD